MSKVLPFILRKVKHIPLTNQNNFRSNLSSSSSTCDKSIKLNPLISLESKLKNKIFGNYKERRKEAGNHSASLIHDSKYHTGRWTDDEHSQFIKGILEYGNEWKMVQKVIKTRSSTQARSHAQKFFLKIKNTIKSQKISNISENILKYIYSSNQALNNGLSLKDDQKKKLLDVILSNIKRCEPEYENINLNENVEKPSNFEDNNINLKKDLVVISNKDNNIIPINTEINQEKKKKEKEIIFCSQKRKRCDENKKPVFKIKKVAKYKYSHNNNKFKNNQRNYLKATNKIFNKIIKNDKKGNESLFNHNIIYPFIGGKYIINNNIINITNNYNDSFIPNNQINNSNNINNINNINNSRINNINNNINNINKNNIYNNSINNKINNNININNNISTNNNINITNNISNINTNNSDKINKNPDLFFDFGINSKKNGLSEEDYFLPRFANFENQRKLLFDNIGFNDPFKIPFFNDYYILGENEDDENEEFSFMNKEYDFFTSKNYE